jgi:hypothetical protein
MSLYRYFQTLQALNLYSSFLPCRLPADSLHCSLTVPFLVVIKSETDDEKSWIHGIATRPRLSTTCRLPQKQWTLFYLVVSPVGAPESSQPRGSALNICSYKNVQHSPLFDLQRSNSFQNFGSCSHANNKGSLMGPPALDRIQVIFRLTQSLLRVWRYNCIMCRVKLSLYTLCRHTREWSYRAIHS